MPPVNAQVVFLTGAAHGIGAETARRLHGRGAKLVLTDLDEAQLQGLAAELGGNRVLTVVADVRDLTAMRAAADQAVRRFGGIDVTVANAGIASYGSVLGVDPEVFKQVIDVNLLGVFHTARATLPAVIERRGYVLIVSSLAAFLALPGMVPYAASKSGVEQLANLLRMEVAHRGVTVGSAHMSWIDTPLVRDTHADLETFGEMLKKLPWPLNKTTSVSDCADAFVKGIEERRTRIYCPGWAGVFRWLKPVMATRVVESVLGRPVAEMLPRMDAEVAALGRSTSEYTAEMERR